MDDKGLIFTTDAVLALAIFMVFSAAFISYYMVPGFAGQDQQSLDAIAADALRVMQLDGTLTTASTYYAQGETAKGDQLLRESLDYLIPSNTGYKLTLGANPAVEDNRGLLVANDVTSRVEVVSAPQEGWMGRAWYKLENVNFVEREITVTSTQWNFHNWYSNFPYFGFGNNIQRVNFSIPSDATLKGGLFIAGVRVNNRNTPTASLNRNRTTSPLTPEYIYRADGGGDYFNYRLDLNNLQPGMNNFFAEFRGGQNTGMGWLSVIPTYTTKIKVPEGVLPINPSNRIPFDDAAGAAVFSTNQRIVTYDLDTGISTEYDQTNPRVLDWPAFRNNPELMDQFSGGVPYVITNFKTYNMGLDTRGGPMRDQNAPGIIGSYSEWGGTYHGTAITQTRDVDLTSINRILDSTVVINAYGGVDGALVEVWDGEKWNIAFSSFEMDGSTSETDLGLFREPGYGHLPSHIYIKDYLKPGEVNKVRVTIWDNVPNTGYDFIGLVDSYITLYHTNLPIKWDNFAYNNTQSATHSLTQTRVFDIEESAKQAYLFVGVGYDTTNLKVEYEDGKVLYDSKVIPHNIDLAKLDHEKNFNVITDGAPDKLKPGNYKLKVTVTGPGNIWSSGDGLGVSGNPYPYGFTEIYSGTRIAILYPEFLKNEWTVAYSSNATIAQQNALNNLTKILNDAGITINPSLLKTEALYTGDLPNNIPVRLDLWRQ